MWMLHFEGEGYAFMGGVHEYLVLTEAEGGELDKAKEPAPGFQLVSCTEIETVDCSDFPASLPTDKTLVPRF